MKLGNCHRVACEMVIDNESFILCQAQVNGQGELQGQKIWHSWCEMGDVVFDESNGNNIVMRKERYYEIAGITEDEVTKFSRRQTIEKMLKYKSYMVFPDD
jgi:hypothetical protein